MGLSRGRWRVVVTAAVAVTAATAQAQSVTTYPAITSRDYAIDLFGGGAIGSTRMIGMGGAEAALAEGAGGLAGNPGAAAIRPPGSGDAWDWDGVLDGFAAGGSDYDNNGNPNREALASSVLRLGWIGYYRAWGFGFLATSVRRTQEPSEAQPFASFEMAAVRLALGRTLWNGEAALGVSLRTAALDVTRTAAGAGQHLFDAGSSSVEAGGIYAPNGRSVRYGARLALPFGKDRVDATCDPLACGGLILPLRARLPWDASFGVSYRFAAAPWNRPVTTRYRDERGVIAVIDVMLIGAVADGAGLEAFAANRLQPSGRGLDASLRAGAEYEWIPGRLRVRAGAYYEPSRVAAVEGRWHGTLGVEGRLWAFDLWEIERRLALSIATDNARGYSSGSLALGFWN